MWLNYDEQYAVSEDGDVMNRKRGNILKGFLNRGGYLLVKIYNKNIAVHQMIAQMFCPKIDAAGLEVDHINRDKTDNRVCNLRWVDKSTNLRNKNSKNISIHKNGYRVAFVARGKYIYQRHFKTMEEAVVARDAFRLSQVV
jgi:hypothetical protein